MKGNGSIVWQRGWNETNFGVEGCKTESVRGGLIGRRRDVKRSNSAHRFEPRARARGAARPILTKGLQPPTPTQDDLPKYLS